MTILFRPLQSNNETCKATANYRSMDIMMAFPDFPQHPERTYSVTYKRGQGNKPEGILTPKSEVQVKDGMEFKVKHTGQS